MGKSLPTAYHWARASQSDLFAPLITTGSNFRGEGTQPVGSEGALSGYGTTDMAGNVKEWCLNEAKDAKRLILGGGFGGHVLGLLPPGAAKPEGAMEVTPGPGARLLG